MTTDLLETVTPLTSEQRGFIQGLRQATVVAMDTETTGLRVKEYEDYLQGISLAYRVGGMIFSEYFPFRHAADNLPMEVAEELLSILSDKYIVFHNRKFDFHSLMTLGIAFNLPKTYDTMLLAHMINENSPYEKSLENCCQKYIKKGKTGKDAIDRFTKTFGWGRVPPHLMAPYAKGDAEITLELWEKLWSMFQKKFGDKAEELWDWEVRFNQALFKMEQRGIGVNQKFCRQYAGIAAIEMDTIEEELGFAPSKTNQLIKLLFEEMKLPILEYTDGSYVMEGKRKIRLKPEGQRRPKMDKHVMEEYERMLANVDDHRARLVLDYRGWQKATSSFYLPFQVLIDSNGKVHCNYKQQGTVTGRLSCSEPNLQQIPRESDKVWNGRIRSAFEAPEGFDLFGFDYSQLEFRLGAAYGQETWLIDEFSKPDADPFTVLAAIIGTIRQDAKTFTYSMIYGAGEEKVAKTMNRTLAENAGNYARFTSSIPGIIAAKKMVEGRIKRVGYARYWTGRRRHLHPGDAFKGFNALLQGGAAEIVKRVLVEISETVCDDNCIMLLQVHDEIVFAIRQGMYDEYAPRIIEIMEKLPTDTFGVKFTVGAKHWGE
jgi:DNA polymerase I